VFLREWRDFVAIYLRQRVWQEFDCRRITEAAHIEAFWPMHVKFGQLSFRLTHGTKYEIYTHLKPHRCFTNTLGRCKIWGFHGGDYEEWCLLGCYAVWLL
jgi:hypothetical protein